MEVFLNLDVALQILITLPIILSLILLILTITFFRANKQNQLNLLESEKQNQLMEFQLNQFQEKLDEHMQVRQSLLSQHEKEVHQFSEKIENLVNENTQNQRKIGEMSEKVAKITEITNDKSQLQTKYEILLADFNKLSEQNVALSAAIEKDREHMQEKLALLNEAEKRLGTNFENIAHKIFEQKSEKFSKTSETGLNQLLSPLKSQIEDFKKQINEQYISEGKERASLKTEILGLKELNQRITEEAAALTNALKGDNKQQGNWGEIVLERVLEESGLRSGHEYEVQKSAQSEEGKRYQPDVVVHLPNDKDIVIDSKVTLVAYERYVKADDKASKDKALKEHVSSLKGHIKNLSAKDYQDLKGIRTLDYVLMFVPIETAFITAIEHDPSLVKLAMDNQIMLVSPTNLLVALRTIHNIWQYEYQNQNAAIIAEKAKAMYDKFANFVTDMEKIGKNLETTSKSYEAAMNKLSSGRGNLIRQAENFKKLGVSSTKSIDVNHLSNAEDDSNEQDDED